MSWGAEMQRALEADGEKLRHLTGEDHGPIFLMDEPAEQLAPCPYCYESCGYVVEFGNDWDSGPWSHQTNIPCRECLGTGSVPSDAMTIDDLSRMAGDFE